MATKTSLSIPSPYEDSYAAGLEELSRLMAEREELDSKREAIDDRITKLRNAIIGLGGLSGKTQFSIASDHPELFPDNAIPDVGFTDAIREVFRMYDESQFSPVQIRDELQETGFDIKKYKNVLASIHSILKRLKARNEITEGTRDGKVVYKCNPRGMPPAPSNDDADPDDIPF